MHRCKPDHLHHFYISGSKNLTTFANRIFYFREPPGLRLALDAEGIKILAAFSARKVKRAAPELVLRQMRWLECSVKICKGSWSI